MVEIDEQGEDLDYILLRPTLYKKFTSSEYYTCSFQVEVRVLKSLLKTHH